MLRAALNSKLFSLGLTIFTQVGLLAGCGGKQEGMAFTDDRLATCVQFAGAELDKIQSLSCMGSADQLLELGGLEQLSGLESLYLQDADLTAFNLEWFAELQEVSIADSSFGTDLSLAGNLHLRHLVLEAGSGLKIDLSQNAELESASIFSGGITPFEVSLPQNGELTKVILKNVSLAEFNFSLYPKLKELAILDSDLMQLETGPHSSLDSLTIRDAPVASLDLSGLVNARFLKLWALTELQSINLPDEQNLFRVELTDTPLSCEAVQTLQSQYANTQVYLLLDESTLAGCAPQ